MLPCEAGGRNEFISKFLSIKKSPPDFDILTCAVDAGAVPIIDSSSMTWLSERVGADERGREWSVHFKGLKLGNAQEFHLEPTNGRWSERSAGCCRADRGANECGGGRAKAEGVRVSAGAWTDVLCRLDDRLFLCRSVGRSIGRSIRLQPTGCCSPYSFHGKQIALPFPPSPHFSSVSYRISIAPRRRAGNSAADAIKVLITASEEPFYRENCRVVWH